MGSFDCTAVRGRPVWAELVVAGLIFFAAILVVAAAIAPARAAGGLDHDAFGWTPSKGMNVIDFNDGEHDGVRKAVPTFRHHALGPTAFPPGTVVISQSGRRLYLVLDGSDAISYPVAVGRMGRQWRGTVHIDGKYVNPAWAPPAEVKRAEPWLPNYIPGGSPHNPMGVRALTLSGDQYAIHGTNRPDSIGHAASFGCIRMNNRDIVDLYDRVGIGTPVVMLP